MEPKQNLLILLLLLSLLLLLLCNMKSVQHEKNTNCHSEIWKNCTRKVHYNEQTDNRTSVDGPLYTGIRDIHWNLIAFRNNLGNLHLRQSIHVMERKVLVYERKFIHESCITESWIVGSGKLQNHELINWYWKLLPYF